MNYLLSESTLSKYEKGYRKASEAIQALTAHKKEPTETGFTSPENMQFYTIRQCNLLIKHRVAERAKKPPKNTIQTGQVSKFNGLPYARIYTSTETGKNYVVYTGY